MHRRVKIILMVAVVLAAFAAGGGWAWVTYRPFLLARSSDPADRLEAVRLLRDRRSGDGREALNHLLTSDGDLRVAVNAARALGADPSGEARALLASAAENHDSDTVRGVAMGQLGRFKATDPSILIEALRDAAQAVRSGAAEGLGHLADPTALPALLEALNDPVLGVRVRAFDAVKAIADAKADYHPGAPSAERARAIAALRAELAGPR